jgi:N-formylglutamate amidohydrolase
VIFGDRHGTTITADLLDAAVAAAQGLGYRTACNAPYAGGYVVGRHGRPQRNVHALQIELDRALYLDKDLRAPGPGFEGACRLIAAVAHALEERLLGAADAIAAE